MNNRYKPILNNHVFYDENMDDVSCDRIREELIEYKNKGYGGFAVNGRSRKKVKDIQNWLPGYFRAMRKYCDIAKELDLEMWIFDEWGFPSGTACGLVLNSENGMKRLNKSIDIILEKGEQIDIAVPERVLSVGVMPVDRYALYNPVDRAEELKPENGRICYKAERKSRIVVVTWEKTSFHTNEMRDIENMPDDETVGSVDIFDKECVRKFIDNMHERYKEVIGDEFGKTVKGFFYDEPEICWDFPYSPGMPDYFKKLNGYDLTEILPEIMVYKIQAGISLGAKDYPERIKKAYTDYIKTCNLMLADNFYGQIEEWCHKNGLLSVGHQDMDHHMQTLNSVSGSFFENNKRNDMPGIDVIHDHIIPERFADFPRYAGSIKRLLNKQGAMSETFAVMGKFMPPDVMRYDMEHQILRGIDKFFLYQNGCDPNAGEYTKELMEHVTETTRIMNEGKAGARIGLLIPLGTIAYDALSLNPHRMNRAPMAWEKTEEIARALCYAPFDFDYVWEDGLENIKEKGFDTIIIPGTNISEKASDDIRRFYESGGKVWSVFRQCEQVNYANFTYYLHPLIEQLESDVKVISHKKQISMATRVLVDRKVYAFLNESDREAEAEIKFEENVIFQYDMALKQWKVWNGDGFFAPRELKIFSTGIKVADLETVEECIYLTDWKFNGKKIDELISWTNLGLENYTGYGEYETEFNWGGGQAKITLGDVRYSAEVTLNGHEYKICLSPWTFYAELPKGHHIMKVRILNSGASEDYAIPDKWHRPYEQPYLKCGLLGKPKIELIHKRVEV